MAFGPLKLFSTDYESFVDVIKSSHESSQDYSRLKFMVESSTLDPFEKALLLQQLNSKFNK